MLVKEFSWQRVPDPFVTPNYDYLLVGDSVSEYWVTWLYQPIVSQTLRIQFAKCIGRPNDWDWRANTVVDRILETISDFQKTA